MFKKKSSILLLLLLAVFSIGLFSTSYAVTESEFKNLIYNSLIYNNNMTSSNAEDIINNQFDSKFASVSQYFNDNYYIFFTRDSANSTEINAWVCSVNNYGSSSHKTYNVSSSQLSACGDACRIRVTYSSDTLNILLRYRNNAENVIPFVYATTQTIFGNSNATIINHSADNDSPYYSSDWFTFSGPYSDYVDKFEFTRNSNLQYVNNGNIAIVNNSDRLGDVQQGHNYGAVEVSCNYWDKVRNSWVEFYWFANANNDNSDTVDIYISDFVNSSNNNIFPNVLVQTIYHSNDPDEFETDYMQPFIISDEHTVISGDTFIPTDTFDDDNYYNDYMNTINNIKEQNNNNDNTDKIIDTLTDDSQVDNILAETFSGDIEDFAHEFGFTPLDNPFTTFLIYVIQGSYDALTGTGNVTLSANYRNYLDFEFNSQDFTTPDSAFKTFLSSMLVCWYLYGNYKYFHYLISLIETAKIDKAVAELGTDEFYDTDIM